MRNLWGYKPLRVAIGVPVLLAAWGGFALVNAGQAGASPMPGIARSEGQKLIFEAGDGTVNNITLTRDAGTGALFLTDAGNTFSIAPTSDGNCFKHDSDTVRCAGGLTIVEVWLADGNDIFHTGITGSKTVVHGSDGDDVIEGGNSGGSLYGEAGKDKIYGGDIRDLIYAGDGDDSVSAGGGNDRVDGGTGKDEIGGGDGNDDVDGGHGRDKVYGGNGNDDLRSDYRDYGDQQYGGNGNDLLNTATDVYGEAGNDHVFMTANEGEYWGGEGNDVISYLQWGHEAYVSLDGNSNDGASNVDCDEIIGCPVVSTHNVHGDFEHVIGTKYNDKISGNGNPNDFDGMGGNDRLYGNGGNDYLDAGEGANQRTEGGAGDDTCVGYGVTARPGCEH